MEAKSRVDTDTEHVQASQPRTHCAHCGTRLAKHQVQAGNQYCGRECLAVVQRWTRTPEEAQCAFCGKALTYEQRKRGYRHCSNQCSRYAQEHGTWDAWVAKTNEYLDTRDNWEKKAPKVRPKDDEIRDWHIQQLMREEIHRWGHR
jgi:endogenous inhibitor of DNA gyrase (YacG/DUF329 family)